jgi:hypothetical protein
MVKEGYDKLIYQRSGETKEAKSIDLQIPNNMTCDEFRIICIRMAHALGYHENNVRETFGDIKDPNKLKDKKQLKLLFD